MNIGSVSSASFSFSSQNLRINDSKSSDSAAELKKQLTASIKSTSNTTNQAAGPAGGPPKELTKSDLEQIKNKISQSGGEGADKIDDLIKNFDQYDNGTGKISIDQFKSYAQQNGISLPKPKQGPGEYQGSPDQGESGDTDGGSAVIKNSVAGVLSKYSSSSSTASVSSSATSSDSSDYSSMSTADLQKLASRGDTKAQEELDKRESSSSGSQSSTTDSAGVKVEA